MEEVGSMDRSLKEQLDCLFNPTSVAVIGASDRFGSWGFGVMSRMLSPSSRRIYPVNPKASEVLGVRAYRSVSEIPDSIDLAIIAIHAQAIPSVMRECVEKGVKVSLIISGEMAEAGEEGGRIEQEVIRIARQGGIRIVGPNSMGYADTSTQFSTLAYLKQVTPGPIGFISQSGTYGQRILRTGMEAGAGFSKFISSGNEADLHLEDYLEYLAQDESTEVIVAYIEGLREGRRFFQLARDIARHKPIIVMKAGKTEATARAARSHTAALTGSDKTYDAMFKQSGVIRADNDEEIFDVASALLNLPLPRGRRVGILSEGGGIAVIATDVCTLEGLEVAPLSASTVEELNAVLPPRWSHGNPIDMTDTIVHGEAATFKCLWTLMEDDNVDMVLWIGGIGQNFYLSQSMGGCFPVKEEEEIAFKLLADDEARNIDIVSDKVNQYQKPLLFSKLMVPWSINEPDVFTILRNKGIPIYPSPQRAARALHHLVWYSEYIDASVIPIL